VRPEHVGQLVRRLLVAIDEVQDAQALRMQRRDPALYVMYEGTDERPWAMWGPSVQRQREGLEPWMIEYGPWVLDYFPDVHEDRLREIGEVLLGAGMITGCMCGCRGDMEITEAGADLLARMV
jgi:hypothetical protein